MRRRIAADASHELSVDTFRWHFFVDNIVGQEDI